MVVIEKIGVDGLGKQEQEILLLDAHKGIYTSIVL